MGKNKLGSFWKEDYLDDNYWDVMREQDLANLEKLTQATNKLKQKQKNKTFANKIAAKRNKDYIKTEEGLAASLSNQIKASVRRRKMDPVEWSTASFRQWLLESDNFQNMFNTWISTSYLTSFKPTIQRIDTTKGYSLDNMKVVISKDKKYEK